MHTYIHIYDCTHIYTPCVYMMNVLGWKLRMVREAGPELADGTRAIKKDFLEETNQS